MPANKKESSFQEMRNRNAEEGLRIMIALVPGLIAGHVTQEAAIGWNLAASWTATTLAYLWASSGGGEGNGMGLT